MENKDFILLELMNVMEALQAPKGRTGKVKKLPKLSKEEIERLEKWVNECPDIRRLDGQVYISLSAFKFMLRWGKEDLMSDTFLDVLIAAKQKRGINPIQQFLVEEMSPEVKAKMRKCGVKI